MKVKFGLDTFGDLGRSDETGMLLTYEESIRNIVKEGVLAEEVGVDIFALGEHHRKEYSISSPDTILAALAGLTSKITLGTAVTVLSSDDPIRLYQRFATINAIAKGRAQVMLGRGSFTESYPLFGYDLRDYNELFEEKILLFSKLVKGGPIDHKGRFTPNLDKMVVYPKTEEYKLDVQIGVGGSPDSIVRAARYGYPLMLAIIGGNPARFKPYITLYQKSAESFGNPIHPVGMHSIGIIADTDEEAISNARKYLIPVMDRLGRERGWGKMTNEQFLHEMETGSFYVGSPETVAKRMAKVIKDMGVARFDLVYGFGEQLQSERFKTIKLYGEKVIPLVKKLLDEDGNNENQ